MVLEWDFYTYGEQKRKVRRGALGEVKKLAKEQPRARTGNDGMNPTSRYSKPLY